MKNLFKCLTVLIAVLAMQGCEMSESSPLKSNITGTWQCEKEERSNGEIYYMDSPILTFHSSGKLSMAMNDGKEWDFATWTVDGDKNMLYVRDNANIHPTVWSGDFKVLSINSSELVFSTKYSYDSYTTTYTFTKYTKPADEKPAGAPKK